VLIKGYEMVIDTGNHRPICVPQPHYGLHESPIMQESIDLLLKQGFIKPDLTSPWGFRITLAPKPTKKTSQTLMSIFGGFASIIFISIESRDLQVIPFPAAMMQ
jgi:hypothetical protein